MTKTRHTVREAAQQLGVSEDAIRKRISRGSIQATRENGTVYVHLDTVQDGPDKAPRTAQDASKTEAASEHTQALERTIQGQRDMIEAQRRTIAQLWEMLGATEEARRDERQAHAQAQAREQELRGEMNELLRGHMVTQQRLLQALESAREAPQIDAPRSLRRWPWKGDRQ